MNMMGPMEQGDFVLRHVNKDLYLNAQLDYINVNFVGKYSHPPGHLVGIALDVN